MPAAPLRKCLFFFILGAISLLHTFGLVKNANSGTSLGFWPPFLPLLEYNMANVHSTIFPPFGRGKVSSARNSGVVAKICHYSVPKKQESSRIRRSRALNGGPEGRAGGKIRHFLRKVVEKVGERDGDTDEHIGIRSTRAFREPCNGGFSPRTPTYGAVAAVRRKDCVNLCPLCSRTHPAVQNVNP